MDNKQIYSKTLGFSLRRVLWDVIALLILGAACGIGFYAAEKASDKGLIGLLIGLVLGLIIIAVLTRYISYSLKAGQIAMMTKGITEGSLPENVIREGKAIVKERFLTVAAFFAVTNVIKGIFNQLGRRLTNLGGKLGGDTGRSIGSAISMAVSVLIAYLSDCCLGWVFYRKNVNAAKATCEGAVLFFKHGKTLLRNMGRIFGMGLASLIIIGAPFAGLFYWIASHFGNAFQVLASEIGEAAARGELNIPEALTDPRILMIAAAVIAAVIIWSIIHSVFIRPFVLVGVLRNYVESGMQDVPAESDFRALDSVSPKFKKLHSGLA
ncbi:MAG: hypothetical protein IJL98_10690 [Lachnospiraceae bacterium]|nr:hypothetical protein [Lachnospiraceae bacterium]